MMRPVGIAVKWPGSTLTGFVGGDRSQQIKPGCARALIGGQRQVCTVRKLHDLDVDR